MKLMVSTNRIVASSGKSEQQICDQDAECLMVEPERASPRFVAEMDQQNGRGQTVVWLIPNVEGKHFVKSVRGDVGLEVFSVFSSVIRSQRIKTNSLTLNV